MVLIIVCVKYDPRNGMKVREFASSTRKYRQDIEFSAGMALIIKASFAQYSFSLNTCQFLNRRFVHFLITTLKRYLIAPYLAKKSLLETLLELQSSS